MRVNRFFLILSILFPATNLLSQTTVTTDGLSWVSTTAVSSDQSPVINTSSCSIQYTIASLTSGAQFKLENGAVNGSGVIFPGSNSSADDISITITFNTPVSNFGMRILDLDEDNMFNQGAAEEYLYNVNPLPSSVSAINGINPLFLDGSTITPNDNSTNSNNNAGGWIYWNGEITTLSFVYHRSGSGYEFVLDSLQFGCPCPAPADYIHDTLICENAQAQLNAYTPGATYLWSTGSTSSAIQPSTQGIYWVEVTQGGCTDLDTAIISTISLPDLNIGQDTAICEGNTVTWSVSSLFGNTTWQDGSTASSFTASDEGMYYASAIYNSCKITDTVVLTIVSYPEVDLGPDTIICQASTLQLNAGTDGTGYFWSDGSAAQYLEVTQAGSFWVVVSNGTCNTSDTIQIDVKPLPENPLPNDTILCPSSTWAVNLSNPSGNLSFEWFNGSTEDHLTISQAGNYWVESTLNGCSRTDTLHVTTYPEITDLTFDSSLVICEGRSTLIGPVLTSSLINVTWDNGVTQSPMAIHEAGTYHFTVSTPCESFTYSVEVATQECFCTLYLPNAFTPDQSGTNDVFVAKYDCPIDSYELVIFNRWGEIVFSTTDPDASWDGRFKGTVVQDGVYVYKLTYTSAQTQTYKELTGHVSVLR